MKQPPSLAFTAGFFLGQTHSFDLANTAPLQLPEQLSELGNISSKKLEEWGKYDLFGETTVAQDSARTTHEDAMTYSEETCIMQKDLYEVSAIPTSDAALLFNVECMEQTRLINDHGSTRTESTISLQQEPYFGQLSMEVEQWDHPTTPTTPFNYFQDITQE